MQLAAIEESEEQAKVDEEVAIAKQKEAKLGELRLAEEKERIATQKKAEQVAATENLVLEQQAAQEVAASIWVASGNFSNCTELRTGYP